MVKLNTTGNIVSTAERNLREENANLSVRNADFTTHAVNHKSIRRNKNEQEKSQRKKETPQSCTSRKGKAESSDGESKENRLTIRRVSQRKFDTLFSF
jgi:hypothetical protein